MPVLYNLNFGHTELKICLPYGTLTEINCEKLIFFFSTKFLLYYCSILLLKYFKNYLLTLTLCYTLY